jgi:hypothetical protein
MELEIGDKIRVKDTYYIVEFRGLVGTVSEKPCHIGNGLRPHFIAALFDERVLGRYRECFSPKDFQVLRKRD